MFSPSERAGSGVGKIRSEEPARVDYFCWSTGGLYRVTLLSLVILPVDRGLMYNRQVAIPQCDWVAGTNLRGIDRDEPAT
jgi:hypothetical protein